MKLITSLVIVVCCLNSLFGQQEESTNKIWDGWNFEIGGDYRFRKIQSNNGERFKEIEGTLRLFASKQINKSLINIWSNLDYYQAEEYSPVEQTVTSRNAIQHIFPLSKRLNFSSYLVFETQIRESRFGILNQRTFGAIKPGIEYLLFPKESKDKMQVNVTYAIGPHYVYRGATLDFTAFQSLDLDAYYNQHNVTFSLKLAINQNLKKLDEANFNFNPNLRIKIFKGLSINSGAHLYYYDRTISDVAYFLRVRYVDIDERADSGLVVSPYWGLNYEFGAKENETVNIRF